MGERVTFQGSTGATLAGVIEMPDGAVRHPRSVVSLEGSDHFLTERRSSWLE
jgi:hypothetical protein